MPPRKLTPEAIASAAVDLADREGIEGLTMRSLARHLGVEAMSLYHHFVGKDALLDAMVDRVYGEIDSFQFFGVGVIVITIVLTNIYVRRANTEFDEMTRQIVAEVKK